jgi:hypothetical protein
MDGGEKEINKERRKRNRPTGGVAAIQGERGDEIAGRRRSIRSY